MRLEKLRQIDLNLLITFAAIAEEKSVTAAASRLLLSQPAVSRALQRTRRMFQDDLLVRSPQGFELTLRGRKILEELEGLLPKIEHLVTPNLFDPVREKSHFRISGPDNVCTVVLPRLCRQYVNEPYQVQFEFLPWQSGIAELVEHGQLDLVLHIDDGLLCRGAARTASVSFSDGLESKTQLRSPSRVASCGDAVNNQEP